MKISVIIPVYNGLEYIADCLKSVTNQTIQGLDIEVIIIDDNSTDELESNLPKILNTLNIVDYKYKKNYETIGPAGSRNKGILASTGDYIAFLDVDDTWEPTKLEKQLALFDDENIKEYFIEAYDFDEYNSMSVLMKLYNL